MMLSVQCKFYIELLHLWNCVKIAEVKVDYWDMEIFRLVVWEVILGFVGTFAA